jgi:hypothetical protein
MEMLLKMGGSAQYRFDLASVFNDRLLLKILELTELKMKHHRQTLKLLGTVGEPINGLANCPAQWHLLVEVRMRRGEVFDDLVNI